MKVNTPVTSVEREFPAGKYIVSRTDLKGIITYADDTFVEISGFSREELLGKNHNIVRHPDMPPAAFEWAWATLKADRPWRGRVKNRCKNGDFYWVDALIVPVLKDGKKIGYMSVRTKPSRTQIAEAEALYRKLNDGSATIPQTSRWARIPLRAKMSALVVGITINWMFSQEYGLINFIIQSFGGTPLEWSLNSGLATFVIGFASVWASIGFNMIIYVGGINNISPDLYEAASIDGANSFQSFLRITVPMLSPTTFLVVLLSTVNLLKEYALVQGITQGGPGLSTTYIIQYIFDKGFNQMEYGYASAISTVVMIVFALIAYAQFKVNNGGET